MHVRVAGTAALAAVLTVGLSHAAVASDRWENGTFTSDDSSQTFNVLRHGLRQANHDLEGSPPPDQDWYRMKVTANHSYEVRASSGTVLWETGVGQDAQLDRVTSAGVVLTPGGPADDDPAGVGAYGTGNTVRWTASADTTEFVRVLGGLQDGPADSYDIEMFDTTYNVARWNNSATQITVFLIRNTASVSVQGSMLFLNDAGGLAQALPYTIPANGLLNLNTATIPTLAGLGGSALINNTGGYGVLVGKAVALEPGTGFTFDTPIEPFPR